VNGATPGACPLCAADDFERFSRRGRDGRLLPTTICRRCGFVWVNPPPDDQALRRYYAWTYRREAKGTPNRTPRQVYRAAEGAAARAAVIRSRLKPGAMVLDVGCGGGELVYLLRRLGVDARGIEPDETYSEFARRELDVPVDTAFLQDVVFPEARFDLVLMYHVLEHVPDPPAVVRRIARWLKPGGALVIEVPNLESRCEAPVSRFHRDHLSYFTRATLSAAVAGAGLTPHASLSPDGGNILIIAERAAAPPPIDVTAEYGRLQGLLSARAAVDFYASSLPYRRMLERARRFVQTGIASRRYTRPREILDAVMNRGTHDSARASGRR
jgi:2-polyprenyl-3-methyl-5-hydroxy-6-metoxy-1,4-benzoquinol methylase